SLADIDPVFYEKSYHVAPARGMGAEKPYALLLRAMQGAGMVGIGRFVLRTKPHVVAIRPLSDALALETLFFADEARRPAAPCRAAWCRRGRHRTVCPPDHAARRAHPPS